jgi:hypothetical protein
MRNGLWQKYKVSNSSLQEQNELQHFHSHKASDQTAKPIFQAIEKVSTFIGLEF